MKTNKNPAPNFRILLNPHSIVSLLNAIVLISLGAWGYIGSESPSPTALIPVVIGIVLLLLNRGLKKENKVIAHVVALLTILILIGLFKPLTRSGRQKQYNKYFKGISDDAFYGSSINNFYKKFY